MAKKQTKIRKIEDISIELYGEELKIGKDSLPSTRGASFKDLLEGLKRASKRKIFTIPPTSLNV